MSDPTKFQPSADASAKGYTAVFREAYDFYYFRKGRSESQAMRAASAAADRWQKAQAKKAYERNEMSAMACDSRLAHETVGRGGLRDLRAIRATTLVQAAQADPESALTTPSFPAVPSLPEKQSDT